MRVFATKDSRELNRDPSFSDKVFIEANKNTSGKYEYRIPEQHLKIVQSTPYKEHVLPLGEKIANRKGRKLKEILEKHATTGYAQHFSEKFHDQVTGFLKKHQDEPTIIREAVEQYDAGKMTKERLTAIYGPPPEKEASATTETAGVEPIKFTQEPKKIPPSIEQSDSLKKPTGPDTRKP